VLRKEEITAGGMEIPVVAVVLVVVPAAVTVVPATATREIIVTDINIRKIIRTPIPYNG
jgi:hypothetical protein